MDGVITHKITIWIKLKRRIFYALQTLRINRSRTKNLATCVIGDSLIHTQLHSARSWNTKEASSKSDTPF